MAALTTANTAGNVTATLRYYDFSFVRAMRLSTGEQIRFYVTDEGSGDILVGVAAHEDGTNWYMRFRHFAGGTMWSDVVDLLDFMESH
ncbi:MAG: hypothetical protein FWC75_09520 [Oscillospiraceae bacterium]|nr:hypothetical protein [Oscillospiraceae bacterium]